MVKAAEKLPLPDIAKILDQTIVSILMKEPYFGHLLASVMRKISTELPTAAVAITPNGVQLLVNPEFFSKELTKDQRCAVIKHEALHLLFRHLTRPLLKNGDPHLFNVAADLVVNQFIKPWPLPDSAITLATFPDLMLLSNQTVEWYYEVLDKCHKNPKKSKKESPQSFDALEKLLGGEQTHSDHRYWAMSGGKDFKDESHPDAPAMTPTMMQGLQSELERVLIQAKNRTPVKSWGTIPSGIMDELNLIESLRKPQVHWRKVLRMFVSSGAQTKTVTTLNRMSKRFESVPGIKTKRESKRVAAVIDTSGSIGEEQLGMFFSELKGLIRSSAEVTIIECDAEVQNTFTFKGKIPTTFKGGGGTSFDPAFEWINTAKHQRFDVCIYLTDGYASTPQVKPKCPLLWVLTPDGAKDETFPFGKVIRLPEA